MPRLIFLILVLFNAGACAAEVSAVRANRAATSTRLVFDVSAPLQYAVRSMTQPQRLVVDFKNAKARRLLSTNLTGTGIKHIRQFMHSDIGLRVVIELAEASRVESRLLAPSKGAGYQLELILNKDAALSARSVRAGHPLPMRPASAPVSSGAPTAQRVNTDQPEQVSVAKPVVAKVVTTTATPKPRARVSRELVIAIDAGHGGQDVGAVGPSGAYEKDIVLAVARELASLIDRQSGMRAVMTRDGDYFLPLRTRMDRARAKRADLFISIHADAVNDRRVQGSSVYVLSQRGASSEAAKWLAANENAADLVGGVSLDDKDRMLKSVLLDLSQTASLDASTELASAVLGGLRGVGRVHQRRVQHAGFMVLKSPDIPSILVETAFISNPTEEKRLRSAAYRQQLARSIFNGISRFNAGRVRSAPRPVERVIADAGTSDRRRHRVSPGETLSGIASRYEVSINTLKRANDIDSEMVRAGSTLRIP